MSSLKTDQAKRLLDRIAVQYQNLASMVTTNNQEVERASLVIGDLEKATGLAFTGPARSIQIVETRTYTYKTAKPKSTTGFYLHYDGAGQGGDTLFVYLVTKGTDVEFTSFDENTALLDERTQGNLTGKLFKVDFSGPPLEIDRTGSESWIVTIVTVRGLDEANPVFATTTATAISNQSIGFSSQEGDEYGIQSFRFIAANETNIKPQLTDGNLQQKLISTETLPSGVTAFVLEDLDWWNPISDEGSTVFTNATVNMVGISLYLKSTRKKWGNDPDNSFRIIAREAGEQWNDTWVSFEPTYVGAASVVFLTNRVVVLYEGSSAMESSATLGDTLRLFETLKPLKDALEVQYLGSDLHYVMEPTQVKLSGGKGNGALKITSKRKGVYGNGISLRLLNPGSSNQTLSSEITGKAITVRLATNGNGDLVTTAGDLKTLIEENYQLSQLVNVELLGDGTGLLKETGTRFLTGGTNGRYITTILADVVEDEENQADEDVVLMAAGAKEADTQWVTDSMGKNLSGINSLLRSLATHLSATGEVDLDSYLKKNSLRVCEEISRLNLFRTGKRLLSENVFRSQPLTLIEWTLGSNNNVASSTTNVPIGTGVGFQTENNYAAAPLRLVVEPVGRKASIVFNGTTINGSVTLTAKYEGFLWNEVSLELIDPGLNSQELKWYREGLSLVIVLPTNSSGQITLTPLGLKSLFESTPQLGDFLDIGIHGTGQEPLLERNATFLEGGVDARLNSDIQVDLVLKNENNEDVTVQNQLMEAGWTSETFLKVGNRPFIEWESDGGSLFFYLRNFDSNVPRKLTGLSLKNLGEQNLNIYHAWVGTEVIIYGRVNTSLESISTKWEIQDYIRRQPDLRDLLIVRFADQNDDPVNLLGLEDENQSFPEGGEQPRYLAVVSVAVNGEDLQGHKIKLVTEVERVPTL